jgi:hypothetical protein
MGLEASQGDRGFECAAGAAIQREKNMRARAGVRLIAAAVAAVVAGGLGRPANGDVTSTFSGFAPNVAQNAAASFEDPPLGTSGSLAINPADASTLYINNRAASQTASTPGNGGVFPFDRATGTQVSNSSGPIRLGSNVMTWTASADPKASVFGNDGALYVAFSNTPAIYRITDPQSDTPAGTKILGNYSNATSDDDPASLARIPTGFGLAGYSTNDILLFDSGIDANNVSAVVAVHADGSDGTTPHILWQRATAAASGIYGATSPGDGYAYWINTAPEHNTIDGADRVSLYRVKGDGVVQTIGLNLPDGVTLAQADEAMTINPADGSIWFTQVDPNGATTDNRTMLRVDAANLAATSDPNAFLADVAVEFTATGFNLGLNGLTFTPDGTRLYASTPTGTDKIWAFDVTPGAVPEPAALSLLALGGLPLLTRRRR